MHVGFGGLRPGAFGDAELTSAVSQSFNVLHPSKYEEGVLHPGGPKPFPWPPRDPLPDLPNSGPLRAA